jgi:hypothetical protein
MAEGRGHRGEKPALIDGNSEERLTDEYQLVTILIAIGAGGTMFNGMTRPLSLRRTSTREYRNGNIFSRDEAA